MTDLETAYRATSYVVDGPHGRLVVRIGERTPLLDELLTRHAAREWAFVTAYNPGSRRLSEDENRLRHVELVRQVDSAGYVHYPGHGIGDGDWPAEVSLLLVGIKPQDAAALGRAFGQNAIVVGTVGEPAQLLWLF